MNYNIHKNRLTYKVLLNGEYISLRRNNKYAFVVIKKYLTKSPN